uniref:Immunoglobulin domain-containing protein n=1 Tax=Hippocampus comes TaxID=109280 RepID=A0A3Q2YFE1_HIPCM
MDLPSTQGPLLRKPKSHSTRYRAPVIIHSPEEVGTVSSSDVTVNVGAPILLRKPYASLEIKCETLDLTEWTLCLCTGSLDLLPGGSLRIRSPNQADEGLYTCTARNRLGSSSRSSWLQIKGENHMPLSVKIGSQGSSRKVHQNLG